MKKRPITIQCDACDWNMPDQDFYYWKKKSCPDCGEKLINKGDIIVFRFIRFIVLINGIFMFLFPKSKTKTVEISSVDFHNTYKKIKP